MLLNEEIARIGSDVDANWKYWSCNDGSVERREEIYGVFMEK